MLDESLMTYAEDEFACWHRFWPKSTVVKFLWKQLLLMWPCCFFCQGHVGTVPATSSLLSKDPAQHKVWADSLPHVVCLKCDPNEVTGLLGTGLDTSEVVNHHSSYKNKPTVHCFHLHLYHFKGRFKVTWLSCILKMTIQDRKGLSPQ